MKTTWENMVLASIQKSLQRDWYQLHFHALVGDTSSEVQFYIRFTKEDSLKQCYELAEEGIIDWECLETATSAITREIRDGQVFAAGKINQYIIATENGQIISREHNAFERGVHTYSLVKNWKKTLE